MIFHVFFLFLVFKHDLFVYLKTGFTGRSRRTRKPSSSSTLHINPRHLSLRSQVSVDGLSNLIRHTRPQRPWVEQSVPCLSVSADRPHPEQWQPHRTDEWTATSAQRRIWIIGVLAFCRSPLDKAGVQREFKPHIHYSCDPHALWCRTVAYLDLYRRGKW